MNSPDVKSTFAYLWLSALVALPLLGGISRARAQLAEEWHVALTNTTINDAAITPSGELIAAGRNVFDGLVSIYRYTCSGALKWQKSYPGTLINLEGGFLTVDGEENVYIAGRTVDGSAKLLLEKLDASGELVWQGNDAYTTPSGPLISLDASGNLLVIGGLVHGPHRAYWLVKYNAVGQKLWETNDLRDGGFPTGLSTNAQGDILISSGSRIDKRSSAGILKWSYITPELMLHRASADGSVFLITSSGLVKLNEAGTPLWARANVRTILSVEADGGILIAERYPMPYHFAPAPKLVRLDSAGNVLWTSPPPGDGATFLKNQGGNYLGLMVTNAHWGLPFYIGEVTPAGEQLWLMTYTNAAQTYAAPRQELLEATDGTYRLVAGSPFEIFDSVIASLKPVTIVGLPQITRQPQSTNIVAGKRAIFRVEASGDPPLSFQWIMGNQVVTGATSMTLRVDTRSPNDSADVFVEISNSKGRVRSRIAELRVVSPPKPLTRTRSFSVALNGSIELRSDLDEGEAGGTAPLWYQWSYNGLPLDRETNATVSITNIQSHQSGRYVLVISNSVGVALHTNHVSVTSTAKEEWRQRDSASVPIYYAARHIAVASEDIYVVDGLQLIKYSHDGQRLWTNQGRYDLVIEDGEDGVITGSQYAWDRYDGTGRSLWPPSAMVTSLNRSSNWVAAGSYQRLALRSLDGDSGHSIILNCDPGGPPCVWGSVWKVLATPDDRFVCAGFIQPHASFTSELAIVWIDETRTQTKFVRPGIEINPRSFKNFDIGSTHDGKVVVSGVFDQPEGPEVLTVCYNKTGEEVWRIRAGGAKAAYVDEINEPQLHVGVDAADNIVITTEGLILKYSGAGRELWRSHGGRPGMGVHAPTELRVTPDGTIYMLGMAQNGHFVLERLDPSGNSAWIANLAPGAPFVESMGVGSGSIYVSLARYDGDGSPRSADFTVKFAEANDARAPQITDNPIPHLMPVKVGSTLTLSPTARGAEPLTYQWYRDGLFSPIPSATNATLVVSNITLDQSGSYFLEVRNGHGAVTTRPVEISVGLPPSFELWDGGLMISAFARANEGGSLRLTPAYAPPSNPLAEPAGWQWSFNGQPITGATGQILRLPKVSVKNAGTYTLTATNAYGTVSRSIDLFVDTRVRTLFKVQLPTLGDTHHTGMDTPRVVANSRSELYLVGSLPAVNARSFITKLDPAGQRSWTRKIGWAATRAGLAKDRNDNVIFADTRLLAGRQMAVIGKLDPNGNLLWERYLPPRKGSRRWTEALAQTGTGELYVAGFEGPTNLRIFVAKLTAHGELLWTKYIATGTHYYDKLTLAAAHDGGVYGGSLRGVFRLGAHGQKLWFRSGEYHGLRVGSDGGVYASGSETVNYTRSGVRRWTLPYHAAVKANKTGIWARSEHHIERLSADGTTLWSRTGYANALAADRDGHVFTASVTPSLVIRAFNLEGHELWRAMDLLPASNLATATDVVVCPNGDVAVLCVADGAYVLTRYRPKVIGSPVVPTISTSTQGQVAPGAKVCFTTPATSPVAWFRNGTQLPSETNTTLCVTADWESEGTYSVATLTEGGAVFSDEVKLHLQRPYLYPPVSLSGEGMLLRVLPQVRWGNICVESSADLQEWQTITNFSAGPAPVALPLILEPGTAQFFRAVSD